MCQVLLYRIISTSEETAESNTDSAVIGVVAVVSAAFCIGGLIVPQAVIASINTAKNAVITFVFISVPTPYQIILQMYSGQVREKIRQPKQRLHEIRLFSL